MDDKLVTCKKCGSDACYETPLNETINSYLCLGCGFTTQTNLVEGSEIQKAFHATLPQLYADLKHIDSENKTWYPATINMEKKGIIFVNGTSVSDWKWTVMKATEIKDEEKEKFKKGVGEYFTHKIDAKTQRDYPRAGFLDAAEYLGLFEN